jgi:hypothetical protein
MKRQRPRIGDFFVVAVGGDCIAVGQVLEPIPDALNSIGVALWKPRLTCEYERPSLTERPLAVLLVTPDLLKRGTWEIKDSASPAIRKNMRPYEQYRSSGWVGARIIGVKSDPCCRFVDGMRMTRPMPCAS